MYILNVLDDRSNNLLHFYFFSLAYTYTIGIDI
jgi:hypothetical protein